MKWISDSELVIDNKIYHITNPEWIKNIIDIQEKEIIKNDEDDE